MGLYEVLKAAKIGAASDVFTTLRGQQAPFAKGGSTPTEKEMEDTPPLSFSANGEPLIDWSMDGASGGVGDATSNLCPRTWVNGQYVSGVWTAADGRITSDWIEVEEGKAYTFKVNKGQILSFLNVNIFDEEKTWTGNRVDLGMPSFAITSQEITTPTLPEGTKYMRIVCRAYNETGVRVSQADALASDISVNEGTTALPYEPYGYKIPVTCGGETNMIYLDEPLGVSDSISMTDTGISIPTIDGSNTLSVGTTVQPSSVYIKYKE